MEITNSIEYRLKNKSHVACVWFVRVLFTRACKNVHADINTYSSANSNLQMTILYLSEQKCQKENKEVAVKQLESKDAGRIHYVSL